HVEIYKQLEWCLENGYSRFEMGVGGMDYKKRWSNRIYRFNHWVLVPQSPLFHRMVALMEYGRVVVKEYLKAKKVNEVRDRLFSKLSLSRQRQEIDNPIKFKRTDQETPLNPSDVLELDPTRLEAHPDLKKEL